jgi:hypothetical protein
MALFAKKVESFLGLNTASAGVSAFGKHPSYADHLPLDLGDQGQLASRLRQTFYNGGIIARVGDWEALEKADKAIPFGHYVLYREKDGTGGTALLRLWPSSDSVHRTDIPMVLAAVCSGVGVDWVIANAAGVLSSAESQCKAARTLDELRTVVKAADEDLHKRVAASKKENVEPLSTLLAALSVEEVAGIVAALRPIWEFLPLDGDIKAELPERAATSRATAWGASQLESISRWSALIDAALGARKSRYFVIAPDEGGWIDLIVGEPSHRQFTCLRAGAGAIPPAAPKSDELTDDFGKKAVAWLRKLSGGKLTV